MYSARAVSVRRAPFPLFRAPFPCAVRPSPWPCAVSVRRGVGLGEQNPLLGVRVRGVGEQLRVRVLQGAHGLVQTRGGPPLVPLPVGRAEHVERGVHEMADFMRDQSLSVDRRHRAAQARGEEDRVGALHEAVVEQQPWVLS